VLELVDRIKVVTAYLEARQVNLVRGKTRKHNLAQLMLMEARPYWMLPKVPSQVLIDVLWLAIRIINLRIITLNYYLFNTK
jgi:hypothetical protein